MQRRSREERAQPHTPRCGSKKHWPRRDKIAACFISIFPSNEVQTGRYVNDLRVSYTLREINFLFWNLNFLFFLVSLHS